MEDGSLLSLSVCLLFQSLSLSLALISVSLSLSLSLSLPGSHFSLSLSVSHFSLFLSLSLISVSLSLALQAYYWLRQNTAEDAKVMSWWDYGYQITAMANRTILVDNNTWNNTHISRVGQVGGYHGNRFLAIVALETDIGTCFSRWCVYIFSGDVVS